MIQEAIAQLSSGKNLEPTTMQSVMEEIMTGKVETSRIVDFLTLLNKKGETVEEITAAVSVMRRYSTRIKTDKDVVLDTCGTGGDKKGTFNVSTTVAFVASGAGITVAKHGNRSVSSCCGSADILEALGVNINLSVAQLEKCLDEIGIAFLFAQNLHPAMKYAMPARKQLKTKTIFNILGPLSNPAGANRQLVGVYDRRWTEVLAEVLGNLGAVHALVVYGEDGLDEVTTTGKTFVSEFNRGKLKNFQVSPEDLGIKKARLEDLKGDDSSGNAKLLLGILKGRHSPYRDIVILNSACAIYAADKSASIQEGIKISAEVIDSGKALKKLELLKIYSKD